MTRLRDLWAKARALSGPRRIVAMLLIGTAVNVGLNVYAIHRFDVEDRQDCADRVEAVGAVRDLVTLVLRNVPETSTSPLVSDLRAAIAPGGDLDEPTCA